jgi:hypothetical protein
MRSTHVLSVEVLAGLPLMRQRLSFLNERFLVKLEELHRIWNNSNCLVRESRMLSRTHFFTEFDLLLLDCTFVPKVHNGVQMGLGGIDESLCPIIAPRLLVEVLGELQGATAICTDETEGLVGLGVFMDDCLDTVVFSLLKCAPFI